IKLTESRTRQPSPRPTVPEETLGGSAESIASSFEGKGNKYEQKGEPDPHRRLCRRCPGVIDSGSDRLWLRAAISQNARIRPLLRRFGQRLSHLGAGKIQGCRDRVGQRYQVGNGTGQPSA